MKLRLLPAVLVALATAAFNVAVVAPAHAAITDPVTGLAVTQAQGPDHTWLVSASWTANADATDYQVKIVDSGIPETSYGAQDTHGTSVTIPTGTLADGESYLVEVRPKAPSFGTFASEQFTAITLDRTAPTGAFTPSSTSAYLMGDEEASGDPLEEGLTATFTITQTALADDISSAADISRKIQPGDGSPTKAWPTGSTIKVSYHKAGTFVPHVFLTDQAGNVADIAVPAITVKEDDVSPRVRITRPVHAAKISSWKRVTGTATDTGTGVSEAGVFMLEKRGRLWWAYDFHKRVWLKGYATVRKTEERSKAQPAFMEPNSAGVWRTPVIRGMKRGTLHVEAIAFDEVFNVGQSVSVNVKVH
ncbi:MAG: hypothetical protein JWP74_2449 [Marmoricola sp.]|nr:hypothetical protein [Marmoricola sp.]